MRLVLGFAGASFAVALPQAGRWYPPNMQGVVMVMGLAGAGNIGVVLDSLVAPRIAEAYGWKNVFGCALIPALLVLILYAMVSREAPGEVKQRKLSDYLTLLKDPDAHWFCFYYTISFGGAGVPVRALNGSRHLVSVAPSNSNWEICRAEQTVSKPDLCGDESRRCQISRH